MKAQICDDTIRVRLNKYAAMARTECPNVPEKVHQHLWRHTRAMHLYLHGMDLTLKGKQSKKQWGMILSVLKVLMRLTMKKNSNGYTA